MSNKIKKAEIYFDIDLILKPKSIQKQSISFWTKNQFAKMGDLKALLFQIKYINNIDEFLKKVDFNRRVLSSNDKFTSSPPKRSVKEIFSSLMRRKNYIKEIEWGEELLSNESPVNSIVNLYQNFTSPQPTKDIAKVNDILIY